MEKNEHITRLFRKYLANDYTAAELDEILCFFGLTDEASDVIDGLIEQELRETAIPERTPQLVDQITDDVYRKIFLQPTPVKNRRRIARWLPYAAAAIIITVAGIWMSNDTPPNDAQASLASTTLPTEPMDIAPGGNRATLTLLNGETIHLSAEQEGIVVKDALFYDDGSPITALPEIAEGDPISWYTLATPNGGTYRLTLPDGTTVWLNAASELRYPSRFDSRERVVELTGEAYFSVTRGETHDWPFRVSTADQTIDVLGTEFNVSAYSEEPITTTLVVGSVALTHRPSHATARLSPGEQAVVSNNHFDVRSVDVQKYVAWKDGLFYLKHTSFDEMIRQIARWYDVEVVYKGKVPTETFSGKIRRDVSLRTILDVLDISNADLQLEGRKLMVR